MKIPSFVIAAFSFLTIVSMAGKSLAGERSFEFSVTWSDGPGYYEQYETVVVEEYYRPIGVDVRTTNSYYTLGDGLDVDVRVHEDAYVYLFMKDPYGQLTQLFPNYRDEDNFLRCGRWYRFPGNGYQYTAEGCEGPHQIIAIATTECITSLEAQLAASNSHNPWPACPISYTEIRTSIFSHYQGLSIEHIRHGRPYSRRPDCAVIDPRYLPGYGETIHQILFQRPVQRIYYPTYRAPSYQFKVVIEDHDHHYSHYSYKTDYHYSSRYSNHGRISYHSSSRSKHDHYKDDHSSNHGNHHNNYVPTPPKSDYKPFSPNRGGATTSRTSSTGSGSNHRNSNSYSNSGATTGGSRSGASTGGSSTTGGQSSHSSDSSGSTYRPF